MGFCYRSVCLNGICTRKPFDAIFSVQYAYLSVLSFHSIWEFSLTFVKCCLFVWLLLYISFPIHCAWKTCRETAIVIPFLPSHLNECNWIHVMRVGCLQRMFVRTVILDENIRFQWKQHKQYQYGIWIVLTEIPFSMCCSINIQLDSIAPPPLLRIVMHSNKFR